MFDDLYARATEEDLKCQSLMSTILNLRRHGLNFEIEYQELLRTRKLRDKFAAEAAQEI